MRAGLTASDDPTGMQHMNRKMIWGNYNRQLQFHLFRIHRWIYEGAEVFYYKLGDKLWKEYGFVDAFSLNDPCLRIRSWPLMKARS